MREDITNNNLLMYRAHPDILHSIIALVKVGCHSTHLSLGTSQNFGWKKTSVPSFGPPELHERKILIVAEMDIRDVAF